VTVVELGWRLEFDFEGKLAWGCVREVHPSFYIGVSEESGCFRIRVRDKIRVELKNEILQNPEIRVGFR
jgi:hypothetical protein